MVTFEEDRGREGIDWSTESVDNIDNILLHHQGAVYMAGCRQFVKIHHGIYSWYTSLSVSMAYFNKTFTKNYSGFSQEIDFEAARKEGRRQNRKPVDTWG